MTTAALCAQDLMVERKIWRHISLGARVGGFRSQTKREQPVDLGLHRAWQAGDDICRRAISGGA